MNKFDINTARVSNKKQIDTASLSWCEMALLKKRDPFMYYSIPGNRDKDEVPGKDLDLSELKIASCPPNRRRSILTVEYFGPKAKMNRRVSFTSMEECKHAEDARETSLQPEEFHPNIVKRKLAISFESCDGLDHVIDVISRLSPQPQLNLESDDISEKYRAMRRGSVLQDILFSSIEFADYVDFNSDDDNED